MQEQGWGRAERTVVVAAGVALVELEAVDGVPPRVQQRHSKRPQPTVLRVPLSAPRTPHN